MAKRYTVPGKWDDPWFWKLSKNAKLLFLLLCDICDWAGFFKWAPALIRMKIQGLTEEEITEALKELTDTIDVDGSVKVYYRNGVVYLDSFSKIQDPTGLSLTSQKHIPIVKKLISMLAVFPECAKHLPGNFPDMKGELRSLISGGSGWKSRDTALKDLQKQIAKAEAKLHQKDEKPKKKSVQGDMFEAQLPPDVKYCLTLLQKVPNYPFQTETDIDWLMALKIDYSDIDIVRELKKKIDWWRDKPIVKGKSNPRLQFRNWLDNARKFRQQAQEEARLKREAEIEARKRARNMVAETTKRESEREEKTRKEIEDDKKWMEEHLSIKDVPSVMKKLDCARGIAIYFINQYRAEKNMKPLKGEKSPFSER